MQKAESCISPLGGKCYQLGDVSKHAIQILQSPRIPSLAPVHAAGERCLSAISADFRTEFMNRVTTK
jgi:hypothetical protein